MNKMVVRVDDCPIEIEAIDSKGQKKPYVMLATKDKKGICINGIKNFAKKIGIMRNR